MTRDPNRLAYLRQVRDLTQVQMAKQLKLHQGRVSRLENRQDVKLSTLYRYVAAMGGKLRIVAYFPDGSVIEIGSSEKRKAKQKR